MGILRVFIVFSDWIYWIEVSEVPKAIIFIRIIASSMLISLLYIIVADLLLCAQLIPIRFQGF